MNINGIILSDESLNALRRMQEDGNSEIDNVLEGLDCIAELIENPEADAILKAQEECLRLEEEVVSLMKPGESIENLYLRPMEKFQNIYRDDFMNLSLIHI